MLKKTLIEGGPGSGRFPRDPSKPTSRYYIGPKGLRTSRLKVSNLNENPLDELWSWGKYTEEGKPLKSRTGRVFFGHFTLGESGQERTIPVVVKTTHPEAKYLESYLLVEPNDHDLAMEEFVFDIARTAGINIVPPARFFGDFVGYDGPVVVSQRVGMTTDQEKSLFRAQLRALIDAYGPRSVGRYDKPTKPLSDDLHPALRRLIFFDTLIGNDTRSLGRVVFDDEAGKVWAIDNHLLGTASLYDKAWRFADTEATKEELLACRRILENAQALMDKAKYFIESLPKEWEEKHRIKKVVFGTIWRAYGVYTTGRISSEIEDVIPPGETEPIYKRWLTGELPDLSRLKEFDKKWFGGGRKGRKKR